VEPPQNANGEYVGEPGDPTIEDKLRGIKRGLLFPYVKNVKVYHCPGDARIDMPDQEAFRSYSITGGMNGEAGQFGAVPIDTYDEIKNPGSKVVFLEEMDERGWNMGSWVIDPENWDRWVDPMAIWHNDRSTLGFADGHAEKHKWEDKRTIEFAEDWRATSPHQPGNPDIAYMQRAYVYRKIK
jgi:prepilin-type processing-associated H-X9-DG protein